MFLTSRFILFLFMGVFTGILTVDAQLISGSATVPLYGPAQRETIAEAEQKAIQQLKKELLQWIADEKEINIDTADRVADLGFTFFLDSCLTAAKTESSFKGKKLTVTYQLTADNAVKKLESFNSAADEKALRAWSNLQEAQRQNNITAIYREGLTALFYAMIRLGPPISIPEGGRDLADDARRSLQSLFDRMQVKSSGLILAGKTGLSITDPPSVTVTIDSIPVGGIQFTGRLQNGTVIFSAKTDDNGRIILESFRIPFVPNGAILEVGPDASLVLNIKRFLDPAKLGLRLDKGQVQSFIFKITPPVYTLDYKASSVSTITMPPEFANDSHVKKFLRDSCFLKERKGSEPVDLAIEIKAQVSSYTYDETEEIGIKFTAEIIVNGLLLNPPKTNKKTLEFEKRYGRYLTPPYGLYFWEANGKFREAVKSAIAGL